MKYQTILQRLEDEKKDEILSAKLYRYTGLMQAIEYFSQRLVFEQIIEAAFDFINELLLVNHSIVYVLENDKYVSKKAKGFKEYPGEILSNETLGNIATFYGNILYEDDTITKFFDKELISSLGVNAIVPLIIDGLLYGFIMVASKEFGEDDYIISEALMRLINTALENYSRYESLAKVNKELDEKVFNLFAINQSSKALLSELRIDGLYNLSVDVFSELTRSRVTGFVLYDERYDNYVLKGFKDVFYKIKDINLRLTLTDTEKINPNKVIIDLSKQGDCEYFEALFKDKEGQLKQLEPKYIVLILKNNSILGFVTLGETVTGGEYSSGIFELIESLASSMYIALSNASLFRKVNEQKGIIEKKLDKLISMNKLSRNISSSVRIETLMDITAKTLEVSFNVEKGFICLYDKGANQFIVSNTIGLESGTGMTLSPNNYWKRVFEGDSVYSVGQNKIDLFVNRQTADCIGEAQGVMIIPIYLDMMEIEMLGVIMVFTYHELQLDNEENLLTIETIAGQIAPVMNNLHVIEMQQRFMLPNYVEIFKKDLKDEVRAALDFDIKLSVIQVQDRRDFVFKETSVIKSIKENFSKVYPFSYNNVFIIENDDSDIEEKIKECTGQSSLKIRKMVLGKDFKDFPEFFNLFR
jgi:transcriptional regulator with GAF, ATPase, and Fis domain